MLRQIQDGIQARNIVIVEEKGLFERLAVLADTFEDKDLQATPTNASKAKPREQSWGYSPGCEGGRQFLHDGRPLSLQAQILVARFVQRSLLRVSRTPVDYVDRRIASDMSRKENDK